jgi:TnpA family transposase
MFIKQRFQLGELDYQISNATIAKHKEYICKLSGVSRYRPKQHRNELISKAKGFAKIHIKPIFIFTEIIHRLLDFGLTMPSYREFQIILSHVIRNEEARLISLLENISDARRKDIQSLLRSEEDMNLAALISLPKSVSNKEIELEIKRLNRIKKIYSYSVEFIPSLGLSMESIKYYSSLVKYYGRSKLARMDNPLTLVYIISYINYRCQRINDNLIDSFQALACRYYTESTVQASFVIGEAKNIYDSNETKLAEILNFYMSTDKNDQLFSSVRRDAFKLLPKKTLKQALAYMNSKDNRRHKIIWMLLGEAQSRFKKNLRRIFLHLDIQTEDRNLMQACQFVKERIALKNFDSIEYKLYPKLIIPANLKPAIISRKGNCKYINFGSYEFLVYLELNNYLTSGDASINDSIKFKSFEQDLLPESIIDSDDFKALDLPFFTIPIEKHLKNLKQELKDNIEDANRNIAIGINQSIKIKDWDKRKWTLPYVKQDIEANDPLFAKLRHINIVEVMNFAHEKTQFLNTFTHLLPKNISLDVNLKSLNATLIAKATNHGIYRMSKISDLTYESLKQSSISMVSLENVTAACNVLSDAIKKLPIFDVYNINNALHGGIDGQKFKAKNKCLKARASAKYYHLGKSVSSGTLLINHVPANAKLFGSNEHESRFIFDLVYNNKTEIQPNIISTDSAGSNFVNFALLHLIGREFAPCFKRITNKETMLAGFEKPAKYKDYFLRPSSQIKEQLIIDEWDNIKRVMASLVLKNTTQSVLVRKLCGTARKNKTKEALWEYDKIIRSNYLFRYIDDEELRVSVRTALNRTEAFHQLKRNISSVNSDALIGSDDDDIDLNDQCTRLLCLVVIYYNAYILSEILNIKKAQKSEQELDKFKHISLIAWLHINFHGYYNFNSNFSEKILQEMIELILSDNTKD